jgi:fermentation-respiration switch protein FrsA (DUF1100 family)
MSTLRPKISLILLAVALMGQAWAFSSLEERSLYHPDMAGFPKNPLDAIVLPDFRVKVQEVYFNTSDNVRLNGWYIPAASGKPSFVFAHGNGGNIGDRWTIVQRLASRGYGVLALDYRGYGRSEGSPSEAGLYRDMEAASNYLLTERQVPYSQQIALGGSIGSGVAVDVATRIPYRAVVLYAAYTSTPDVAAHLRDTHQLGWLGVLPLRFIMRQHFDSLSKMHQIQSPLLIMHGENDEMMPLSMPRALYGQAASPYKKLLIIPDAGHNDVFHEGADRMLDELEQLLAET